MANNIFDQIPQVQQDYNNFEKSYLNFFNFPMGLNVPIMYDYLQPGDRYRHRSQHFLRCEALVKPLLTPIKTTKDFYFVPFRILHKNWAKILVPPRVEADELPDQYIPAIEIRQIFRLMALEYYYVIRMEEELTYHQIETLVALEKRFRSLFGDGSLFDFFNISITDYCKEIPTYYCTFTADDDVYDFPVSAIDGFHFWESIYNCFTANLSSGIYSVNVNSFFGGNKIESLSSLEYWFYGNPRNRTGWQYVYVTDTTPGYELSTYEKPISMLPFLAYQAISYEYYVKSKVDDIISYEDYLTNIFSLLEEYLSSDIHSEADLFTLHMWDILIDYGNDPNGIRKSVLSVFEFSHNILQNDYFTSGSVTNVYGNSQVQVPVDNNSVNVVDIRQSLRIQSFLNMVNRVGSKINEYTKGIFGFAPTNEELQRPYFLTRLVDDFSITDVTSQAAYQDQPLGTMAGKGIGASNNFAFNYFADEQGLIIGLIHLTVPTIYESGVDRRHLNLNRYDMFNPMLQNIGEQECHMSELMLPYGNKVWSYQPRYIEYKFCRNQAHAGFKSNMDLKPYVLSRTRAAIDKHLKSTSFSGLSSEFVRMYQDDYQNIFNYSSDDFVYSPFIAVVNNISDVDSKMNVHNIL